MIDKGRKNVPTELAAQREQTVPVTAPPQGFLVCTDVLGEAFSIPASILGDTLRAGRCSSVHGAAEL